jgi:hypothetical protein
LSLYFITILKEKAMNINFTIGLGFLEFCCHFVAMVCFIYCGVCKEKDDEMGFPCLFLGASLTIIGAHL